MNAPEGTETETQPTTEEMHSALFAYLVMQQSNMATMLLGKTPHPETGQTLRDLESAKLFIDQLEMLEAKTKGNLNADESKMLKQNLMALRLAFVEAADAPAAPAQAGPQAAPAKPESAPSAESPPAAEEEEHRKKFSKKY
jgi:hypothetical protein